MAPAKAPKASPSFEDERRALQATAAPLVKAAIDPLIAMGVTDEDAWLDALEKRIEVMRFAARFDHPGRGRVAPIDRDGTKPIWGWFGRLGSHQGPGR